MQIWIKNIGKIPYPIVEIGNYLLLEGSEINLLDPALVSPYRSGKACIAAIKNSKTSLYAGIYSNPPQLFFWVVP
jgi:hypothetical protein